MKNILAILFCLFSFSLHAGNFSAEEIKTSSFCGPIPAVCYPTTISGGLGIGIYFVSLNQINNSSSNPPMLEDFTCTDSTWLVPGVAYNFEMHTGTVYEESARAWIDFSNDGNFDPSEIVYEDSALIYLHQGTITVPVNAVNTFTPIRMRIGSDYSGNYLNGCNDAYYGQYEDYTIYYGAGIGIDKFENETHLKCSPNPFHSICRIEISNPKKEVGNYKLKIFNVCGALIRIDGFENINPCIIDRQTLNNGLYFFELATGNNDVIGRGKFVIE